MEAGEAAQPVVGEVRGVVGIARLDRLRDRFRPVLGHRRSMARRGQAQVIAFTPVTARPMISLWISEVPS